MAEPLDAAALAAIRERVGSCLDVWRLLDAYTHQQEQVALVPALVAALREIVREATCDAGKIRWPPGVEVVRHAQALLAHPALTRLGEHT